jgi:hypothetical protein
MPHNIIVQKFHAFICEIRELDSVAAASGRSKWIEIRNCLHALPRSGFEGLVDAEPFNLAYYLEQNAASTGQSAFLFLAETIRAVHALLVEHAEYGGVQLAFFHKVDDLVRERLPVIERADQYWAAKLAKDFRDEILAMVHTYDPNKDYE